MSTSMFGEIGCAGGVQATSTVTPSSCFNSSTYSSVGPYQCVPVGSPFKPSAQSSNLRQVDLARMLGDETVSEKPLNSIQHRHLFSERRKAAAEEKGIEAKVRAQQTFPLKPKPVGVSETHEKGFLLLLHWLQEGENVTEGGLSSSPSPPSGQQMSSAPSTTVQGYIMLNTFSGPRCSGNIFSAMAYPVGVCVVLQPKQSVLTLYYASLATATSTLYPTNDCTGPGFTSTTTLNTTCQADNNDDYYGEPDSDYKFDFSPTLDFPSNGFYHG